MSVFGDEIGGPIHALSLKTQVPHEPGAIAGGEQHTATAT